MPLEPSFRHDSNSVFGKDMCDILVIQRWSPVLLVHLSAGVGFAPLARIPSSQEARVYRCSSLVTVVRWERVWALTPVFEWKTGA